jgi:hypothetical protein
MLSEQNHHILIAAHVSRSWPADFKSSKQFVFLEQVAADNNDPEMSHFIEAKFLTDQVL